MNNELDMNEAAADAVQAIMQKRNKKKRFADNDDNEQTDDTKAHVETSKQVNESTPEEKYKYERDYLIHNESAILDKIIEATKYGRVAFTFGAGQIVTTEGVRINGVIVLKSSVVTSYSRTSSKNTTGAEQNVSADENVVDSFYEIWSFFHPEKPDEIGPLCWFRPNDVKTIINLRSGLDVIPS